MVGQAELDKNVELGILRDGKPIEVTTQIKEQPQDYRTSSVSPKGAPSQSQNPAQSTDQDQIDNPLSAIDVNELTPEIARQLDLPNNAHGVVVTGVDPDSGMAELQKGDVIEEINQQPIASVSEYKKIAASLDPNQPQVLSVCRHRVRSFLVLRPQ
jgi:serine protease Do